MDEAANLPSEIIEIWNNIEKKFLDISTLRNDFYHESWGRIFYNLKKVHLLLEKYERYERITRNRISPEIISPLSFASVDFFKHFRNIKVLKQFLNGEFGLSSSDLMNKTRSELELMGEIFSQKNGRTENSLKESPHFNKFDYK